MIALKGVRSGQGPFLLTADCTIARGSLCAVLGASGAGKSTLLSLVAGFAVPERGDITIAGNSMSGVAPSQRPVSMVFQEHNLFAHLDVWHNVALGVSPSLALDASGQQRVRDALARVGLSGFEQRIAGSLSGGEAQRVALARALVRKRPVLLLDEPFAALDPGLRRGMLQLVATLHREHDLTTLLVTHQPGDARDICDQVIFIDKGMVRAPVATDAFFRLSGDEAVAAYLG